MSAAADPDRDARLLLSVVGEPGDPALTSLVAEEGGTGALAALRRRSDLGELRGSLAARLAAARPRQVLQAAGRRGIRFLTPTDEEWPPQLGDLEGCPLLHERGGTPVGLWVRGPGRLEELAPRAIAVVGARSATSYGARIAGEIGAAVAAHDRPVVSGAAFGIDQAAHRGALAVGGTTVAVLASGVDRAYPAAHADLIEHIAETGLVVSEAAPGGAPTRIRFLARNRLIAALSTGVVVVEAAIRSGALNTANWADGMSRPVLGVPGPVTSATSQGVHELIRTRHALLVCNGADVLEATSAAGQHLRSAPRGRRDDRDRLTTVQRQVLDAVPVARAAGAEQIARAAGLAPQLVRDALAVLEAGDLVQAASGKYRLVALRAGTAPAPTASG